jgi:hypothetical protein
MNTEKIKFKKYELIKLLSIADTLHDFYKPIEKNRVLDEKHLSKERIKEHIINNTKYDYFSVMKIIINDYITQFNNNSNNNINNNNQSQINTNSDFIKYFEFLNTLNIDYFLNTETNQLNNNLEIELLNLIIKFKKIKIIGEDWFWENRNAGIENIIKNNNIVVLNHSNIKADYVTEREIVNVTNAFNAMGSEYKNKNKINNKINNNIHYSITKKNFELLFLKEIEVKNNKLIITTIDNKITEFNENKRISQTKGVKNNGSNNLFHIKPDNNYGVAAFGNIIYNIKIELLKGNFNIGNSVRTPITTQLYVERSNIQKYKWNKFLSNTERYSVIHSKILELFNFELVDNKNIELNSSKIQFLPLEYIFALFDIKRGMDLLQIKLCKTVNTYILNTNNNYKCFYMSNDKISLAFSLLYDCPTVNSAQFKSRGYLYYKKQTQVQTQMQIQTQLGTQQTKQGQIFRGGSKINTEKHLNNIKFTQTFIKPVLLNTKTTKTNNKQNIENILYEKISISFLKKQFKEKLEFIQFLNNLPTKQITYFDFFVFHFIFTVKI